MTWQNTHLKLCILSQFLKDSFSYLVRVQNFQEGFVDVWLTLEAVLDLIDIIYSVVEFHRLVVLKRWPTGWCAANRSVGLNRRWLRWSIGWDGWVGLAGGCMGWRMNWLVRLTEQKHRTQVHYTHEKEVVRCSTMLQYPWPKKKYLLKMIGKKKINPTLCHVAVFLWFISI